MQDHKQQVQAARLQAQLEELESAGKAEKRLKASVIKRKAELQGSAAAAQAELQAGRQQLAEAEADVAQVAQQLAQLRQQAGTGSSAPKQRLQQLEAQMAAAGADAERKQVAIGLAGPGLASDACWQGHRALGSGDRRSTTHPFEFACRMPRTDDPAW